MNEKRTSGFVSILNHKKNYIDLMIEKGLLTKEKGEKAKRLIYNPLLGFTNAKEIDEALTMGAIKKWKEKGEVRWGVATEEKIINGKKVIVIAQAYREFEEKKRKREKAAYYNKESMDNLIRKEEKGIDVDKIFKVFPGSKKVN